MGFEIEPVSVFGKRDEVVSQHLTHLAADRADAVCVMTAYLRAARTKAMVIVFATHLLAVGANAVRIVVPAHFLAHRTEAMAVMASVHLHLLW